MAILFFFVAKGKTQCVLDGDWQSIDATCPTSSDGAICCDTLYGVVPGTGLPPYACSISPAVGNYNATTNCFENLPVGTYTVTTTSSDGCIGVFTNLVVMSTYAEISATFNITPASCGASDGSICATVTGGSGSFSYNWTGPPLYNTTLSTTNCLSGVPAGIYQLFIDDVNSICSRQYSRTISSAVLTATATATAATCAAPCNGSILVDLSSAIAPVTISWSGTSSGSVSGINDSEYLITGLCQGTYSVTVDDASSCAPVVLSGQTIGLNTADIIIGQCNNTLWNPQFWDGQNDITLGGNLIIMPGACLVIEDMTIRMQPGKMINVKQSGDLTALNSVFDAGCGNTWVGFRVEGVSGLCDAAGSRGDLLLEDCTITRADIGVANFSFTGNAQGGRITGLNSTWINNSSDVHLYDYSAALNGTSDQYAASFDHCQFLTNVIPPGQPSLVNTRIVLIRVNDVRFRACDVINTATGWFGNNFPTALNAATAQFQWIGMDESEISGFGRGIWSNGNYVAPACALGYVPVIDVASTTFRCQLSVFLNNSVPSVVMDNSIFPPPAIYPVLPAGSFYTGIQMQNNSNPAGMQFLIADNSIDLTGMIGNNIRGIAVDNCKGFSNYVIRNTLTGCGRGIDLQNRNRSANGEGVHFECNTFYGCWWDVTPRCSGGSCGSAETGVASLQADTYGTFPPFNNSAGNIFSNSISAAAYDDIECGPTNGLGVMNGFDYWYRQPEFAASNYDVPNDVPNNASVFANVQPYLSNNAPYNVVIPWEDNTTTLPFCASLEFLIPELEAIQSSTSELKIALSDLREIHQQLVDGGNTEEMLNNMMFGNFNDALMLYQELMSATPALSEEVMIAAIQREYELPSSLLTAVLAANPSAAKSAAVWNAIDTREIPLDAYQKMQIKLGLNQTSFKEQLEHDIFEIRTQLDIKTLQGIRYMSQHENSEVNSNLIESFDLGDYEGKRQKAAFDMMTGYYANAYDLIKDMSLAGYYSEYEKEVWLEYAEMMLLHSQVIQREPLQLTTEEVAYLNSIRNDYPCDIGHYAQDLLTWFSSEEQVDLDHFCAISSSERSLAVKGKLEQKSFQVYPNPSSGDFVICKLAKPSKLGGQIQIFDQTGRVLISQKVQIGQVEIPVILENLEAGVYSLSVQSNDGQVSSTSIIVQ